MKKTENESRIRKTTYLEIIVPIVLIGLFAAFSRMPTIELGSGYKILFGTEFGFHFGEIQIFIFILGIITYIDLGFYRKILSRDDYGYFCVAVISLFSNSILLMAIVYELTSLKIEERNKLRYNNIYYLSELLFWVGIIFYGMEKPEAPNAIWGAFIYIAVLIRSLCAFITKDVENKEKILMKREMMFLVALGLISAISIDKNIYSGWLSMATTIVSIVSIIATIVERNWRKKFDLLGLALVMLGYMMIVEGGIAAGFLWILNSVITIKIFNVYIGVNKVGKGKYLKVLLALILIGTPLLGGYNTRFYLIDSVDNIINHAVYFMIQALIVSMVVTLYFKEEKRPRRETEIFSYIYLAIMFVVECISLPIFLTGRSEVYLFELLAKVGGTEGGHSYTNNLIQVINVLFVAGACYAFVMAVNNEKIVSRIESLKVKLQVLIGNTGVKRIFFSKTPAFQNYRIGGEKFLESFLGEMGIIISNVFEKKEMNYHYILGLFIMLMILLNWKTLIYG